MAGTAARPLAALPSLVSPYLPRLSGVCRQSTANSSCGNLILIRCYDGAATMTFRIAKTWPISQTVGAAGQKLSSVSTSSPLGKAAVLSKACGVRQQRSWRNLSQLSASSSLSPCAADVPPENAVEIADGSFPPSSSGVVESPVESEGGGGVHVSVSGSVSSSRRSKRICYYHSQGLCTMVRLVRFFKSHVLSNA